MLHRSWCQRIEAHRLGFPLKDGWREQGLNTQAARVPSGMTSVCGEGPGDGGVFTLGASGLKHGVSLGLRSRQRRIGPQETLECLLGEQRIL